MGGFGGAEACEATLMQVYGVDYMREFWLGNITLRKLRVLLQNVPAGTPSTKADGHLWDDKDNVLFRILGLLHVIAGEFPGVKEKDLRKAIEALPSYPWSEESRNVTHYGDLGGASVENVLTYVESLGG